MRVKIENSKLSETVGTSSEQVRNVTSDHKVCKTRKSHQLQTFTLRVELTHAHKNIFTPLASDTVALQNRNQFWQNCLRLDEIPHINLHSGHILRLCRPILLSKVQHGC